MQIKAFNDLILEIQNKEIKFGRFADEKITADMVKLMMTDIAYDIFYKNFDTVLDVNMESVGKVASLCSSHIPQRVDVWQAIFVLTNFKNGAMLPDKYIKGHQELYYVLGGASRDFALLNKLLNIVELNAI